MRRIKDVISLFLIILVIGSCQSRNNRLEIDTTSVEEKASTSIDVPMDTPTAISVTSTLTHTPRPSPTQTITPSPSLTPTPSPTPTKILPWYEAAQPLNSSNIENLAILEKWVIDDPAMQNIYHLAFSPDNQLLAVHTSSWAMNVDTKVTVWRVKDHSKIFEAILGNYYVSDMTFSPDGALFAIGSWDYSTKIWRTDDWNPIINLENQEEVNSIVFSPDGNFLVVGSNIGSLYGNSYRCALSVWNTANWKIDRVEYFNKNICVIKNIVFSNDGKNIAYSTKGNMPQVRNFENLELLGELDQLHDSWRDTEITFSEGGTELFVHIWDYDDWSKSTVIIWDYLNNELKDEVMNIDGHIAKDLVLLPDGDALMVIPAFSPNITTWNVTNSNLIENFEIPDVVGYGEQRKSYYFASTTTNDKRLIAINFREDSETGYGGHPIIAFLGVK